MDMTVELEAVTVIKDLALWVVDFGREDEVGSCES